ncbi:arylsulfatase B-like isoform X2 [Amblyomma americanum]
MRIFFLAFLQLWSVGLCNKTPPHIIMLIADDLGWDDVSFHGSSQIPTPNLDALAADGIILNSHYVQSSCAPSRAALMTGLYPIRTGMQAILAGIEGPWGLPLDVRILPQYLKERGYETHLVGKWHLGYYSKSFTPTFRGFDSFYGFYNGDEDYYSHDIPYESDACLDFWFNTDPVRSENGSYSTTLFTQRAQNVIRQRDRSKPLFLMVSYQAPHGTPDQDQLQAPQKNVDKFPYIEERNRTIFAGMVDALDESVGEIFQTLHEADMLDNIVILFSSDNGGVQWGPHGSRAFNWPLRGSKNTLWEGGTRVAAFVWSPLLAQNRTVSNQLMHITDWLPTLYSLAGGNVAELGELDGNNMWSHLSDGSSSPREELLYDITEMITYARAVRHSRYKLVVDGSGYYADRYRPPPGSAPYQALDNLLEKSMVASVLKRFYRKEDLELPKDWRERATLNCRSSKENFYPNQSVYLFDIDADPCELNNVASSRPDVLQFMENRLDAYQASASLPLTKREHTSSPFRIRDGLCAPWHKAEEVAAPGASTPHHQTCRTQTLLFYTLTFWSFKSLFKLGIA